MENLNCQKNRNSTHFKHCTYYTNRLDWNNMKRWLRKKSNFCVAVSADGCAYRLEKPHCVSSLVITVERSASVAVGVRRLTTAHTS